MFYTIRFYFILLIIYSFIGWLIEVTDYIIEDHKLVNRGFLIGPYCPIYGFGSIFIILILNRFDNPILLFFMAIIICSILEYFTSFFMEKIFHARWWDYSNRKFNINGRICLETMLPFGLLGTLLVYFVNPFIVNKINMVPINILNIIAITLFIIILLDIIISLNIIFKFKITMKLVEKDGTEEITKRVKEILFNRNWLFRRLIKAFPNIKNHQERLLQIQSKIDKEIRNIPVKIINTIDRVKK